MAEKDIESKLSEPSIVTAEGVASKGATEAIQTIQEVEVVDPKTWSVPKKVLHTAIPAPYGFTV